MHYTIPRTVREEVGEKIVDKYPGGVYYRRVVNTRWGYMKRGSYGDE